MLQFKSLLACFSFTSSKLLNNIEFLVYCIKLWKRSLYFDSFRLHHPHATRYNEVTVLHEPIHFRSMFHALPSSWLSVLQVKDGFFLNMIQFFTEYLCHYHKRFYAHFLLDPDHLPDPIRVEDAAEDPAIDEVAHFTQPTIGPQYFISQNSYLLFCLLP
jgi:hypothetical protein